MSCSDWKIIKLEDSGLEIEDGDRGKNYPKKSELLSQGYCPFLNNKNILDDKFNFDDVEFITKQKDELLRKGRIKVGDIVLTTRGSVGNVGLFHENLTFKQARINSGMVIIRNNDELFNINYLYQLLKSPYMKQQYKSMSTGTAQPQLPIKDIKKLNLIVPPIKDQEKIANILSSLDDKIELNNEMNKNLEEMAQSIFKRWFVDFEFANEDGEPYKSSGGEMIESELGMIPKDWEVKTIGDIGNIITGKTPSSKVEGCFGNEYKFITPRDINDSVFILKTERGLSSIGVEKLKRNIVPKNSVGVSCIGSNLGEVYITGEDSITNQQINTVVLNEDTLFPYVYIYLKNMKEEFLNMSSGSAVPIINKTSFSKINILIPDNNLLQKYVQATTCYFDRIKENLKEIENLTILRDALLPKLMSGEIIK